MSVGHSGGTLHAHSQARVLHRASISHLCLCSCAVLCRALSLVEHHLLLVLVLLLLRYMRALGLTQIGRAHV